MKTKKPPLLEKQGGDLSLEIVPPIASGQRNVADDAWIVNSNYRPSFGRIMNFSVSCKSNFRVNRPNLSRPDQTHSFPTLIPAVAGTLPAARYGAGHQK